MATAHAETRGGSESVKGISGFNFINTTRDHFNNHVQQIRIAEVTKQCPGIPIIVVVFGNFAEAVINLR